MPRFPGLMPSSALSAAWIHLGKAWTFGKNWKKVKLRRPRLLVWNFKVLLESLLEHWEPESCSCIRWCLELFARSSDSSEPPKKIQTPPQQKLAQVRVIKARRWSASDRPHATSWHTWHAFDFLYIRFITFDCKIFSAETFLCRFVVVMCLATIRDLCNIQVVRWQSGLVTKIHATSDIAWGASSDVFRSLVNLILIGLTWNWMGRSSRFPHEFVNSWHLKSANFVKRTGQAGGCWQQTCF